MVHYFFQEPDIVRVLHRNKQRYKVELIRYFIGEGSQYFFGALNLFPLSKTKRDKVFIRWDAF
jgi:hypothetical protein